MGFIFYQKRNFLIKNDILSYKGGSILMLIIFLSIIFFYIDVCGLCLNLRLLTLLL